MGNERFRQGLNLYLKTHQYSNAETADLWRALQDYAPNGVDVARVMDSWTRQMGFPLVTVNKTQSGFTVTQKRFLSNRDASYDPSTSKFGYAFLLLFSLSDFSGVAMLLILPVSLIAISGRFLYFTQHLHLRVPHWYGCILTRTVVSFVCVQTYLFVLDVYNFLSIM